MKDIKRFQGGKEQITKTDPVIQVAFDFSKAILENEHHGSIMSKFQEKKKFKPRRYPTKMSVTLREDILKKMHIFLEVSLYTFFSRS